MRNMEFTCIDILIMVVEGNITCISFIVLCKLLINQLCGDNTQIRHISVTIMLLVSNLIRRHVYNCYMCCTCMVWLYNCTLYQLIA